MNARIARVVYIGDYSDLSGLELLKQGGIALTRLDREGFKDRL
jgi:hypothetical protein